MGYRLGVDLGTTYTAAAVHVDGRVEMLGLGIRAMQVPSVVFVRRDGEIVVGEAAEQQGAADPSRVVREFKRRIGDSVPLVVGGAPFSAQALTARLLAWVVGVATERQGGPPEHVCVTLSGELGPVQARPARARPSGSRGCAASRTAPSPKRRRSPTRRATGWPRATGSPSTTWVAARSTRPSSRATGRGSACPGRRRASSSWAASTSTKPCSGTSWRRSGRTWPRSTTWIRRRPPGSRGCARLRRGQGGAVVQRRHGGAGGAARDHDLGAADPRRVRGHAAPRRSARPWRRRGGCSQSAGVEPGDLSAIVLVGGSSRIPLVSQMLSAAFGRPLAMDNHPKHDVALGAAIRGTPAAQPQAVRAGISGGQQAGDRVPDRRCGFGNRFRSGSTSRRGRPHRRSRCRCPTTSRLPSPRMPEHRRDGRRRAGCHPLRK